MLYDMIIISPCPYVQTCGGEIFQWMIIGSGLFICLFIYSLPWSPWRTTNLDPTEDIMPCQTQAYLLQSSPNHHLQHRSLPELFNERGHYEREGSTSQETVKGIHGHYGH